MAAPIRWATLQHLSKDINRTGEMETCCLRNSECFCQTACLLSIKKLWVTAQWQHFSLMSLLWPESCFASVGAVMIYQLPLIKVLLYTTPPLWTTLSMLLKPICFLSLITTLHILFHLVLPIYSSPTYPGTSNVYIGWRRRGKGRAIKHKIGSPLYLRSVHDSH